ncbi:MAG TPA: hypothetical protein VGK67_19440 [Myxococcales bacterium]|jgi:hypothetical protein
MRTTERTAMPDQPTDRPKLENLPQIPAEQRPADWQPEKETDPSKLVDYADPSSAPEEGAY